MAIGPVQLLVLGFNHPDFHGEIIEELERQPLDALPGASTAAAAKHEEGSHVGVRPR